MPSATTSPSRSSTPSSGAVITPTGDRHIPPSTRADGSLRKEIKIRPGYRPPEDVEVYRNRTAEAWKTQGNGSVPGAASVENGEGGESKAGGKNAKRREARKKAKATEGVIEEETAVKPDIKTSAMEKDKWRAEDDSAKFLGEELDPDVEKEKQARNLKKKLRQARDLKEKKEQGDNLLPEQFAKVIKIQELIRQLDGLGFDSDGIKKAKDVSEG